MPIEPVRTDMHCTHCSKTFIATFDLRLDGNHIVECPHCGHEHCRVVKDGVVTSDRWDSHVHTHKVPSRSVWKSQTVPLQTSTAAHFLRERWLNREDVGG